MEMGDRKNKYMEDEDLNQEEVEDVDVEVTLPKGSGIQRSRKVRKRDLVVEEEEVTHDGDDVKVTKSVKASSTAEDGLASGVGEEGGEENIKKVGGGGLSKLGEASSSSVTTASGRSEDGSSEQSAEEEDAHPCLFIDNVLEVIFEHLVGGPGSRKDIQNIRLVCKAWTDSATRVYRRTGPTTTFDFEECEDEVVNKEPDRDSLTAFMDTMKSSKMIPVQKFSFEGSVFCIDRELKVFRDFLLICGPEVVSLKLSIQASEAEKIMVSLNDLPELDMLKLRSLELHMSEDHDSEVKMDANQNQIQVHEIVTLVQLLLTAAKKLRELDLSYWPPCCCSAYRREQVIIMEQLGPVIATVIPRTVKTLTLYLVMNESTFYSLAGVGLKLDTFVFSVPSAIHTGSVLGLRTAYEFLQSQATTLTDLRVWSKEEIILEFPRLDELLCLELKNIIVSIAPRSEFAKTFPKLRRLLIGRMDTEDALRALLSSIKSPSPSLKVLQLPGWRYTSLAPHIKDVAKSFPGIVDLTISLHHSSRETLLEIFRYLDKLESLNVSFYELGLNQTIMSIHWADSLFSGISERDCSAITRLEDYEIENVNLNNYQRQPSILNLTKLRKLSVTSVVGGIRFTNFAAHFVFLEMKSLREICFSRYATHPALFSPEYVDLFRERFTARGGLFDNDN